MEGEWSAAATGPHNIRYSISREGRVRQCGRYGHGSRKRGRELDTARTIEAERLHPRARSPHRDLRSTATLGYPGFAYAAIAESGLTTLEQVLNFGVMPSFARLLLEWRMSPGRRLFSVRTPS